MIALLRVAAAVEGAVRWLTRPDRLPGTALALVLLAGGLARALRVGEGLPYLLFWDEPFILWRAHNVLTTGDLNPHAFWYGSLVTYQAVPILAAHALWLASLPPGSPDHITSVAEVAHPTGLSLWSTSFPSLYWWARCGIVAQGTATLAVVYWIARQVAGPWAGVIAAALLGAAMPHVELSARVLNEAPAGLLIAGSIALSMRFLQRGSATSLIGAALLAGFATSTKYNMGVVWVVPMVALAQAGLTRAPGYRHDLWVAVTAGPVLGFLLTTPYALLDLRAFMDHAGSEIDHYVHRGMGQWTDRNTGVAAAVREVRLIAEHLSVLPLVLAVVALPRLGLRYGPVVLAFPLLYGQLMSSTIVLAHRNWVPVYPVVAVLGGIGAVVVGDLALPRLPWWARRGAVALVALALGWRLVDAVKASADAADQLDTRTVAVLQLEEMAAERGWTSIGFAENLQVHRSDLARLSVPTAVAPIDALLCEPGPPVVVLPTSHVVFGGGFAWQPGYLRRLGARVDRLTPGREVLRVVGRATIWGAPTVDPGVRVIERDAIPERECERWRGWRELSDAGTRR